MKKRFKEVYYIIQTQPLYKVCGFCFNREDAETLAQAVETLTGVKGKVISFTREELKKLNYVKV